MATRREEVRVTADVSSFVSKMATAGAAASAFAKRLDEADSRMSNLVQSGLALAPALVPLGAAAVPALAGLANQLGVATLAAGTAVLAFHGVGDAVKAIDAYKAAPTAANFQKLSVAMEKLGPAGQNFALFVENLKPKLQQLQNVAQQGLLPGVQDGLTQLLPLIPEVNRVIFSLSSTLGDLVSSGARDLNSSQWQSFFSFLEADASVTLTQMGKIAGNLAQAFAHLWQAFDPLSQGFTTGFLHMAESFNKWAAGLSQTQGFQNFITYIQKSGPEALHALSALGNALLQIVEAAAPVGSVALPAITAVANAVSSLADSSVGPTLIAIAAGVGVLGRSLALLRSVGARGGGEGFLQRNYVAPAKALIPALREATAATRELQAAKLAVANVDRGTNAVGARLGAIREEQALTRQTKATERLKIAEKERTTALREGAGAFLKGAAGAAGLALATSGMADSFGLSNTASLALIGTMAGPWGAAIGGGVGLVKDLASANDDAVGAMKALNREASSSTVNFVNQRARLDEASVAARGYFSSIQSGSPTGALRSFSDLFTHTSVENTKILQRQQQAYITMGQTASDVYAQLNHGSLALTHATDQQLTDFANHITPALTQAGIKTRDFLNSVGGSKLRLDGLRAIRSYFESLNSASGKSKAVAKALADMGSQMDSDAAKANALKSAMDALFGTELNQSAATDAWTSSLRDLRKQIDGTNGAIHGNSKAALDNRAAIRGSVQALEDKIVADANAHVSGDKLVQSLVRGRNAIIRQGVAAGASRQQMQAYLDTLGLTPKNLVTIIQADVNLSDLQKVEALARLYKLTPKQVHTVVAAINAGKTHAQIAALLKQYGLTPRQIHTLLTATDQASAKARAAKKAHDAFAKAYKAYLNADDNASGKAVDARKRMVAMAKKWLATLSADDKASPEVRSALNLINLFDGKHATATITTNRVTHYSTTGSTKGKPVPLPPGVSAAGNIFRAFAAGDVANGHRALIERMPKYRMWAEPETKGEAYIPLANDWRRPRAVKIWEQTGKLIGALANGGLQYASTVRPSSPVVTTQTVQGGGGLTVQFNAPVNGTDANELARRTAARLNNAAAAMAGMP